MFDWIYKKRLRDDLETWVARGWVSPDGALAILKSQDEDDGKSRLPMALAGIGMVCVALALFAFIAANWSAIPKTLKLLGIAVLILGTHCAAAIAAHKGKKGLADLATGFATLVFVGGMALVGQIFHLPSDWAGGALLVCLGGMAAAWLTGSTASLVVAAVAAMSWQITRSDLGVAPLVETWVGVGVLVAVFLHPFRFPASLSRWAAISLLLVTYGRWFAETAERLGGGDDQAVAMLLGGAAGLSAVLIQFGAILDLFAKWSSYKPARGHAHWLMLRSLQDFGIVILCILLVFILTLVPDVDDRLPFAGLAAVPSILPLALAVLLCGFGALLSFKTPKALALFAAVGIALVAAIVPVLTTHVLVLSVFVLAALIAMCALGTWYNNRFWMLCAYLGLTAVALWLLEETIGSLLGQSLFFLVAGVLLLAVALWLARVLRKQPPATADTKETAA